MYRSGPYDRPPTGGIYTGNGGGAGYVGGGSNSAAPPPAPSAPYRALPGSPDDPTMEAYVSRTLYLCKLPNDVTEEAIKEACEVHGDVKKVSTYPSKQIAFVEYWDIRDAQKARQELKGTAIGGKVIDVQYSKVREDRPKEGNTGTLYVRPVTTERHFKDPNTVQEYRQLFGQYGEVKKVNPNRKREAEKFIEFYDLRSAEAALQALNGSDFNGVTLEVQFANHSSKTLNKDSKFGEMTSAAAAASRRNNNSSYGPIRGSNNYFDSGPDYSAPTDPSLYNNNWTTNTPVSFHWGGAAGPSAAAAAAAAAAHAAAAQNSQTNAAAAAAALLTNPGLLGGTTLSEISAAAAAAAALAAAANVGGSNALLGSGPNSLLSSLAAASNMNQQFQQSWNGNAPPIHSPAINAQAPLLSTVGGARGGSSNATSASSNVFSDVAAAAATLRSLTQQQQQTTNAINALAAMNPQALANMSGAGSGFSDASQNS